jgi:hypothetical protein
VLSGAFTEKVPDSTAADHNMDAPAPAPAAWPAAIGQRNSARAGVERRR